MEKKSILIVGTYDTKEAELRFMEEVIEGMGGSVVSMDVSILGGSSVPTDYRKEDVVGEVGYSLGEVEEAGDENCAMQMMAEGASRLVARLYYEGKFEGVIVLGGTMGTDLALDVCGSLPLGVPKYIVSTVSFSPLIPGERLSADIQMMLWAGGLYGLNEICKESLSQAAGAVWGATCAVRKRDKEKPILGMTSLGKTALKYMVRLKPALEERGFEVAIFHATGMGGRAFEDLASMGVFSCVFDFCTQEVGNCIHGSDISSGESRLTGAGLRGVPQLVSPGCYDLVDIVGWKEVPDKWSLHVRHAHNRLLTSIVLNHEERKAVARAHSERLAKARGAVALLLPRHGMGEWDREGEELHDREGLDIFLETLESTCPRHVETYTIEGHINDEIFAETALSVFDSWCEKGIVKREKFF